VLGHDGFDRAEKLDPVAGQNEQAAGKGPKNPEAGPALVSGGIAMGVVVKVAVVVTVVVVPMLVLKFGLLDANDAMSHLEIPVWMPVFGCRPNGAPGKGRFPCCGEKLNTKPPVIWFRRLENGPLYMGPGMLARPGCAPAQRRDGRC
jgi:hypothetical protein